MNWTSLRHRMLYHVANCTVDNAVYRAPSVFGSGFGYRYYRSNGILLRDVEKRCVGQLYNVGLLCVRNGQDWNEHFCPLALTDSGRALLAEWTTQHGEPR